MANKKAIGFCLLWVVFALHAALVGVAFAQGGSQIVVSNADATYQAGLEATTISTSAQQQVGLLISNADATYQAGLEATTISTSAGVVA